MAAALSPLLKRRDVLMGALCVMQIEIYIRGRNFNMGGERVRCVFGVLVVPAS